MLMRRTTKLVDANCSVIWSQVEGAQQWVTKTLYLRNILQVVGSRVRCDCCLRCLKGTEELPANPIKYLRTKFICYLLGIPFHSMYREMELCWQKQRGDANKLVLLFIFFKDGIKQVH